MAGLLSRPSRNAVRSWFSTKCDWNINLIKRDNPYWNDLYMMLVF